MQPGPHNTFTLPDIDYTMDGDEEEGPASIELNWTPPTKKKKDKQSEARAGTINIMLQFIPVRSMLTRRSVALTKTWYFESTVLGMVFLSMVALALQSPAEPPSPGLYGTLRILEIFVATHMGVELLLEMQPLFAAGKLHTCIFQAWWQLHVFVLLCNWAAIMMPAVTVAVASQADLISSVSSAAAGAGGGLMGNSTAAFPSGGSDNKKLEKLFSVGRVLRIVRPIRTLRMIENVDIIVSVLQESVALFATVCLLLLFLLSILALVGISSFNGALGYTCVGTQDWGVPPVDSLGALVIPTCSEPQNEMAEEMDITSVDGAENPHCPLLCPAILTAAESVCEGYTYCAPKDVYPTIGADAYGYRHFDNFPRALVTVFVQTTGDGGMHTMPLALYSAGVVGTGRAWFMSFCTSVLLNLLALNLFLAVCCSAYSDVQSRADELAAEKQKVLDIMREEEIRSESDEERIRREEREEEAAEGRRPLNARIADKNWVTKEDYSSFSPESPRAAAKRPGWSALFNTKMRILL